MYETLGKFEEYNVFVQIGKLFHFWHESRRRRRIGFCPRNRAGHHVSLLQLPLRIVTVFFMLLAVVYLPLWFFAANWDFWYGFLGGYLGFVLAVFALIILLFGVFSLRIRYTLTDMELIVRQLGTRRINLRDLRLWNRTLPLHVKPGRRLRLSLDASGNVTLWFLRSMEGGTHFVMLLSEATGLSLIEPFLGVASDKK